MQLSLTGQNLEITPSIHDYASSKFNKLTKHFSQITQAHAILSVEKQRQKAEATLNIKGNDIHAESSADNLYAAIDLLVDKLDRQLIKHKEKQITNRTRSAAPPPLEE